MEERSGVEPTAMQTVDAAANIVWIGDSLSVLGAHAPWLPLAWRVGWMLSDWSEEVQYLPASMDPFSPRLESDGTEVADSEAGFGGRSVLLAPGQRATVAARGQGASVLWTRTVGGGQLEVCLDGRPLNVLATDGPQAWSRLTTFAFPDGSDPGVLTLTAAGAPVRIEGVYLHERNLHSGLRIWPAGRSGATTRQFIENPGWVTGALDSLAPSLVVVATGTNDEGRYRDDLSELLVLLRECAPDAQLAVWVAPPNDSFPLESAAAAREVAALHGCGLIDAARVLGHVPTHDGVHHTNSATAICAAHAAAVISGSDEGSLAAVAQLLASNDLDQSWHPGRGAVGLTALGGEPTLTVHAQSRDAAPSLALMTPAAARMIGQPGCGISMGPGGSGGLDLHLSRGGPGLLSLNGGAGQIDLARLNLIGPPDGVAAAAGGVLVECRTSPGRTDLVATVGGRSQVLTPDSPPLEVPVPCALGAHRSVGSTVALRSGDVVWVPFPALSETVRATHVWMHVVEPSPSTAVTAAIFTHAGGGRPGALLGSTPEGALEVGGAGPIGAGLEQPVVIPAGRRWWVAVHLVGDSGEPPVVRAAAGLMAGAPVQLGAAPVAPEAAEVDGSMVLTGVERIPREASRNLGHSTVPAPLLHVSLEETWGTHPSEEAATC